MTEENKDDDFKKCLAAINTLMLEKSYWNEKDLADEAGVDIEYAKKVIKSMNL